MPNYKDFEPLHSKGEFAVEPNGWSPLTIEYGYDNIGRAQFFHWRVKGSRHTFSKSVSTFNYESGGEYEESIKEFLESFREEVLGWTLQSEKPGWVREYVTEYNQFINI